MNEVPDILLRTALELEVPEILHLCATSKYYMTLCQSDPFWKRYCMERFNIVYEVGSKDMAELIYLTLKDMNLNHAYPSWLFFNLLSKLLRDQIINREIFNWCLDTSYGDIILTTSEDIMNLLESYVEELKEENTDLTQFYKGHPAFEIMDELYDTIHRYMKEELPTITDAFDLRLLSRSHKNINKLEKSKEFQILTHQPWIYLSYKGNFILNFNIDLIIALEVSAVLPRINDIYGYYLPYKESDIHRPGFVAEVIRRIRMVEQDILIKSIIKEEKEDNDENEEEEEWIDYSEEDEL